MRLSARRGHLLAEALCALALSGVLATAAALSLGSARRSLSSTDRLARADRTALESVHMVAAMLADADSVRLEGDTAVALALPIGAGAVCARAGWDLVLPPTRVAAGSALAVNAQPLESGDLVSVLVTDSLGGGAHWLGVAIDSIVPHGDPATCGEPDGWMHPGDAGGTRVRLVLRDALPASVRAGSPFRALRRGRLALYHAGAGDWMLGWRRCGPDGTTCGAVQPVAGPLRTPGSGGLRIRWDGAGAIVVEASGPQTRRPARLTVRPQ